MARLASDAQTRRPPCILPSRWACLPCQHPRRHAVSVACDRRRVDSSCPYALRFPHTAGCLARACRYAQLGLHCMQVPRLAAEYQHSQQQRSDADERATIRYHWSTGTALFRPRPPKSRHSLNFPWLEESHRPRLHASREYQGCERRSMLLQGAQYRQSHRKQRRSPSGST
jgi:hypothetical protein